jgi:Ribonuclease G/E
MRQIRKQAVSHEVTPTILIKAHPEVITFLYDEEGERLDDLERQLKKRLIFRATASVHHEEYEVSATAASQSVA